MSDFNNEPRAAAPGWFKFLAIIGLLWNILGVLSYLFYTALIDKMMTPEVLDAMPVERFRRADAAVQQQRVALDNGRFRGFFDAAPQLLARTVRSIEEELGRELEAGYESEVSLSVPPWIADLAGAIDQGFIFLLDYGCAREKIQHVDDLERKRERERIGMPAEALPMAWPMRKDTVRPRPSGRLITTVA